jgi:type VI protein secretion system component VasK
MGAQLNNDMWILHFLPDSVILWSCNILLLTGLVLVIAGFFAHRIPLVWQYQLPFRVLGIALLVAGVYFRGGYAVEQQWRERVAEVEQKLQAAEAESAIENVRIQERVVKKTEYITRRGQDIIQYVDREIVKYDTKFAPGGQCEIPREFVVAHNRAAEAPPK